MIKTAVLGVGNMGSKYAYLLQDGAIEGMELSAITRIKEPYKSKLKPSIKKGLPVFESADQLFASLENGQLKLDAVIIATPHYSHSELAIRAFKNGLHVLSDKPSGVYSRQARLMEEAADESGKIFGMVFNQRTMPIHQKLYELVNSKKYGELKRLNWVATDWYRPETYYKSAPWRASWEKDGGGVLLNQCPHNFDLIQWICGMPKKLQAFCWEGHFHNIEVEDDASVFFEWENGATGTFITSTGDAPGVNRLEISLEEAMIVCENGKIKIGSVEKAMGGKEKDYRKTATDFFRHIDAEWSEIIPEKESEPYQKVLSAFADEIYGKGKCIADGREGRKSLILSNAMYLSSWKGQMIKLPKAGSKDELDFEKEFEAELARKIKE
ncbi:Gfo/Idh/MocA family oxidoreductase [uncultured Treponema sp.]|uniref:Gfo/Idh/MocA family protein n=1 Tax=uncultured Treponema sp. TaxID=162155 RepID=UPI0025E55F54|nr:Gfo/Idh/MocA family oxidoreductase [uncultured Treponema sp.]